MVGIYFVKFKYKGGFFGDEVESENLAKLKIRICFVTKKFC